MMGLGAGSALSTGGRRLIQLATTAALVGGVGLAGLGAYGYNLPSDNPAASFAVSFAQENATLLLAIGVAAVVLGAIVRWWASRRMMKKMTSSMDSMMSMGGMMGGMGPMGLPGAVPTVKLRCRSCGSLGDEGAKFCPSCGTSMA